MKKYNKKIVLLRKYYKKYGNYDNAVLHMLKDNIIKNKEELTGLTLDEIGYVLGITRERVRQLEAQAKKKFKQYCLKQKKDFPTI